MTIRQYLFNNLWYGENSRERNRELYYPEAIAMPLVMPNTSRTWGIDASHWNPPPIDLQRMKDMFGMKFAIFKGCDGSLNTRYYNEHKAAAKAAGIPFGAYCWLYPNNKVSIDAQVNAWYARFVADPPPLGLFIDAEWTTYGGSPANPIASDLRMAHDRWFSRSRNQATTYTAPAYANAYLRDFDFSREPLWIANYEVSSPTLPAGAPGYAYWQFTSKLDGKRLDPNGNAELDGNYAAVTIPIPADDVTFPFPGVKQITGVRNGWRFWLQISDPSKVRYEVVHPSVLSTVSNIANAKGAQMAWNGGEWDRVSMPKDYSVSNGIVYVPRKTAVPSFIVTNTGELVIDHRNRADVRQAISGLRYLVYGGVIQSYLDGTDPQYTEGHSRSVDGLDASGIHMRLTSEGRYPNQGLTLKQAAEIMKQYGAVIAHDEGGGGDTTVVIDGTLLNTPEDISGGVNVERRLPQILLAYTTGEPQTMAINKVTITWDNGAREREKPRVNTADRYGAVLVDNSVHYSDYDVVADMDAPNDPNKKWIKLQSGWYIAVRYPSSSTIIERARVEPIASTPEPPAPSEDIVITQTLSSPGYVSQTVTTTLKPE